MVDDEITDAELAQIRANQAALSKLYVWHAQKALAQWPTFKKWEAYAFACLARAHQALESAVLLLEYEADGAAVIRVLYEHVVTFAWLMIDPDEHYLRLLHWELGERKKMTKDLASFTGFEPSAEEVAAPLILIGMDTTKSPAPATPDRALAADKHWGERVTDWQFHLRENYANLFRPYSIYVHPTVLGLMPFFSTVPGAKVDTLGPTHGGKLIPEAVTIFADALVIASHTLGWPRMDEIIMTAFAGVGVGEPDAKV